MQHPKRWLLLGAVVVVSSMATLACAFISEYESGVVWPEVPVVEPGQPGQPPADAIVLLDGEDLSQWHDGDQWIIRDGYAEVRGSELTSKQSFGSCQLHIEWASPEKVSGTGQGRGNSGVYFMGKYEVQILDSYDNETYPDGQAASIYKQHPPLVNVCRKPGEWQTYDIVFNAPEFDARGKLVEPASMTVFHNGVLVQNHFELTGGTFWHKPPSYTAHAEKLPLKLQHHGNPVRFRNIWLREL